MEALVNWGTLGNRNIQEMGKTGSTSLFFIGLGWTLDRPFKKETTFIENILPPLLEKL